VDQIWNSLAKLLLALTVFVIVIYSAVFIATSSKPLGAKPEAVPIAVIFTPTPRNTPIPPTATTEPTWTSAPSPTPGPTDTRRPAQPTNTPRDTIFLTPIPSATGTPTPTRHPFPFKLSDDGVAYETYPFRSSCDWLGIAGEVRDQEGNHIPGISVVLNGGGLQNIVTASGNKPQFGESGWEHFLDNKVKEGDFEIQLWNKMYASSTDNQPVSEKVTVRTRADCRANMIYLVFEIAWDDYAVP
jgi:hypothetical protein